MIVRDDLHVVLAPGESQALNQYSIYITLLGPEGESMINDL